MGRYHGGVHADVGILACKANVSEEHTASIYSPEVPSETSGSTYKTTRRFDSEDQHRQNYSFGLLP
jgi:hypothetical protein